MPYRDFAAEATERARSHEPIVFTLPGSDTQFRAVPTLTFGVLQDIVAAPEIEENEAAAITAISRFFTAVVVPDHHDKLTEGLRATDPQTLRDVIQWLVTEYTARPTLPSSASQDGQPAAGEPSTSRPDEKVTVPSLP